MTCADPVIVTSAQRKLDMAVEVPSMPLGPVASNEMWTGYNRLVVLVEQPVDLVFVNTRRMPSAWRIIWVSASVKTT